MRNKHKETAGDKVRGTPSATNSTMHSVLLREFIAQLVYAPSQTENVRG
jgi:hypothetical protein